MSAELDKLFERRQDLLFELNGVDEQIEGILGHVAVRGQLQLVVSNGELVEPTDTPPAA